MKGNKSIHLVREFYFYNNLYELCVALQFADQNKQNLYKLVNIQYYSILSIQNTTNL